METLNIAICEDSPADAALLRRIIDESGVHSRVFTYENGEVFLSSFEPGFFQLILLDIYFDGQHDDPCATATGVDVALKIRETDNTAWIAFTTISLDHAVQGYKVRADRYLQKPLDKQEVVSLLQRAAEHFKNIDDKISVIVDRKPHGVRIRDIMYAEVRGKQSLIHTQKEIITTYTTIDDIAKMLNFTPFLRCHRCYVVNMDCIERIDRDIQLNNGDKVYVSRNLLPSVKEAYRKYIVRLARGDGA